MFTVPADDAGASTADRYNWQACMAAADGLSLYMGALDDNGQLAADHGCRIVCEHHEDWIAIQSSDAELVSAKHREPSRSVFTTLGQLVTDGGLAHLFNRWHTLGERPTCRLVTTAGLRVGPPQDLDQAATGLRIERLSGQSLSIDGDHHAAITGFAQALLGHRDGLPDTWQSSSRTSGLIPTVQQREQASRFLSMLSIQHGQPTRAYVGYAAPGMYVKPVLDRLGHSAIPPEAVWEAVLGLFRTRMRAAGSISTGALPTVLAYQPGTALSGLAETERELASRIVSLTDIDVAVRTAIAHPGGYLPLPGAMRASRMAIKMSIGNCADSSIERAEQLRLDYQRYWRARTNSDPTARAEQQRLRRALLRISDDAAIAVTNSLGTWGAELWSELQVRIDALPAGQWWEDMDADLLLGGICDLANRCHVWFSARFDIDAEVARIRAQRGATP